MTPHPLNRREYVWLQATIAALNAGCPGTQAAGSIANNILEKFDAKFPEEKPTCRP